MNISNNETHFPGESLSSINTNGSGRFDDVPAVDTDHEAQTRTYPSRPKLTNSATIHKECGCGEIITTITFLMNDESFKPFEVFAKLGKANSCTYCIIEGVTRCITMGLRNGVPAKIYALQLEGIQCPSRTIDDGQEILSCLDAIGKSLREYMQHVDNDTIEEYLFGIIK